MDFMMHKMITVISSSNLLMNSGLLNISKPLVQEISLVRWFDFLCLSLMMKVSPDLKCHNMILQSPVTGSLSQVKALFFVLKLEELNRVFAMSSWELRKLFCVHARAFQNQSSRCFLEEEDQRKEKTSVLFLDVGKEASQRRTDPASPFSWFWWETSAATKHCLALQRDHNTLELAPRVKMLAAWICWSLRTWCRLRHTEIFESAGLYSMVVSIDQK